MYIFNNISGKNLVYPILLISLLVTAACAPANPAAKPPKEITTAPLSITILHVGDTHSYVIPHDVMLKFKGQNTLVTLGGWSQMAAAIEDVRLRDKNVMLLHSGDTVEGTMWSTRFSGLADFEAMNKLNFDAVVLGNHEFSNGPQGAANLVNIVKFPVLAANLDVSAEPSLDGKVKPYTIVEYDGQKIGIIGLITPTTELTGYPGKTIKFLPVEDTARKYIDELNALGINKIVVLSHLGYGPDVNLAKSVAGIDIIVGGHSHTLMGGPEFEQIGLKPEMPYPTELTGPAGDRVLIVHAWENNQMLGQIKLDFDGNGKISNFSGQPFIPAMSSFKLEDQYGWNHLCSCMTQFSNIMEVIAKNPEIKTYWTNPEMDGVLQPYINQVSSDLNAVVGIADDDLVRGPNQGPGPIVADAFLWTAGEVNSATQIAIVDSYNVRSNIYRGNILANDLYMVLPLQHNLITAKLKGNMIKMLIEAGIDAHIAAGDPPPCFDVAGLKMTIDMSRKSGDRITSLQVKDTDSSYKDMNMDTEYTLVTTDYLADKGITSWIDKAGWLTPFASILKSWAINTTQYTYLGVKDVDALTDYLRIQKNIKNTTEERIILLQPAAK
ncbi:MAG: bifunctional metallophosphatase/5'-nucleotidase [Chloroflexi bacterium]|nr:bifunctional metallophosphatase/5'-nucleotidase [Chloroflexota bacterium]